jgi:hypothetical protein
MLVGCFLIIILVRINWWFTLIFAIISATIWALMLLLLAFLLEGRGNPQIVPIQEIRVESLEFSTSVVPKDSKSQFVCYEMESLQRKQSLRSFFSEKK